MGMCTGIGAFYMHRPSEYYHVLHTVCVCVFCVCVYVCARALSCVCVCVCN